MKQGEVLKVNQEVLHILKNQNLHVMLQSNPIWNGRVLIICTFLIFLISFYFYFFIFKIFILLSS